MKIESFESFNEKKKQKQWIKDAIKKPGALKAELGKDEEEKLTKKEINAEIAKLDAKDKDKEKPGSQLSKKDATKKRRLVLAKTLMSLKEHQETENYMFFGNLKTIKRLVDELLEMDEAELDAILTEHDWASDHVSVATENLEQVFDFLAGHSHEEYSEMDEVAPEHKEAMEDSEEDLVKGFESFNK